MIELNGGMSVPGPNGVVNGSDEIKEPSDDIVITDVPSVVVAGEEERGGGGGAGVGEATEEEGVGDAGRFVVAD